MVGCPTSMVFDPGLPTPHPVHFPPSQVSRKEDDFDSVIVPSVRDSFQLGLRWLGPLSVTAEEGWRIFPRMP